MTSEIDQILVERKSTHGEYAEHARCTQAILRVLEQERNWVELPDIMRESLHMIAHKMGRILVGNPFKHDHWDDIAGYARLVPQRIVDGVGLVESSRIVPATDVAGVRDLVLRCGQGHVVAERPGTPEDGGHHSWASDEEERRAAAADYRVTNPIPNLPLTRNMPEILSHAQWLAASYDARAAYLPGVGDEPQHFLDRRLIPEGEDWWGLPRFQPEMNSKEYSELSSARAPLYLWNGEQSKWLMRPEFRERWGRS
jgi:hypothetical protein